MIMLNKSHSAFRRPAAASKEGLPPHGRIACDRCHGCAPVFNRTRLEAPTDTWRITANPMAWGNDRPEVLVLGFSKGPNQIRDIETNSHDDVAFKAGRANVGKVLAHVGLMRPGDPVALRTQVDAAISDQKGRFGWGSLIRCTVERHDPKKGWTSTGGKMIDGFLADPEFGQTVAENCASRFLGHLPAETKLIVMFGMGQKLGYVKSAYTTISRARPGKWRWINEVAYWDGEVTVVHVEHFKAQGSLIPDWMGLTGADRAKYGHQAWALSIRCHARPGYCLVRETRRLRPPLPR
ncbi:hypothetical protein AB9K41_31125 [Cribrihabitans sp. XS_ASV171]